MDELNIIKASFERGAKMLGDYESMSKSDLANGYCDADEAGDKEKKDSYFLALMLRYWYKIYEWRNNSASLKLDDVDFVDWLIDSLNIAFRYRVWRDSKSPMYNDPNGPDKVINRCCFSTRGRAYQHHNKDKRKANIQTNSIEAITAEAGDCALSNIGCTTPGPEISGVNEIIGAFLKSNKVLEALIVDGIAYHDSFRTLKTPFYKDDIDSQGRNIKRKYYTTETIFDSRKLVKHLTSIDQAFISNYFCKEYSISTEVGEALLSKLKKMAATNNASLYKSIKKTLIEIKENHNLLDLCFD